MEKLTREEEITNWIKENNISTFQEIVDKFNVTIDYAKSLLKRINL